MLYNCNRFVGDIAQNMGLQSPANSLLMPKEYINALKSVNGGRAQLSGPAPSRQQAATAAKRAADREAAAGCRQRAAGSCRERAARLSLEGGGQIFRLS